MYSAESQQQTHAAAACRGPRPMLVSQHLPHGGKWRGGREIDHLTAAKTAAMPMVSYRRWATGLEYRPSTQSPLDGSGRSAHACGSEGWGFEPFRDTSERAAVCVAGFG